MTTQKILKFYQNFVDSYKISARCNEPDTKENLWVQLGSPHPILFEGVQYKNCEAALQASKTLDGTIRKMFRDADPQTAIQMGKNLPKTARRPHWDIVEMPILEKILEAKFQQHPELKEKLLQLPSDTQFIECKNQKVSQALMRVHAHLIKKEQDPETNVPL